MTCIQNWPRLREATWLLKRNDEKVIINKSRTNSFVDAWSLVVTQACCILALIFLFLKSVKELVIIFQYENLHGSMAENISLPKARAWAAAGHKAIPPCSHLQLEAMRSKADCAQPLAQRCCAHQPRRRPTWTTRHPARFKKHADCWPLLQQSLPNRGRVV